MSSSVTQPARSSVTRTRTGCWTCRARRKKCDEIRPYCQACRSLGLSCEGYGVRLKWAIRGRPCVTFRHAPLRKRKPSSPVALGNEGTLVFQRSSGLGEGETEKEQVLSQHLGLKICSSLSIFEKEVLYDFADWGALTLFSKPATESIPDPGRFDETLGHCAKSELMILNSLTYQITLDPKHAQHVDEYYGRSIRAFRQALSNPCSVAHEMTPFAGILLCSISMNRAMPFSIHLIGMASIFQQRYKQKPSADDTRELAGLIGVLDLPTHTLGRQNKHLNMWRIHCMGQKGVEEVTSLPCSLIDLFASPMDDDIEERLLQWSGEPSEPVMCRIWKATQYAGLIMIREFRLNHRMSIRPELQSTASVLKELLDLLGDLRVRMDVAVFATTEALLFPLVAAGSQPAMLTVENRVFIRECIAALANDSLSNYPYYQAVVLVLETLWASDESKTLDHIAKEMAFELGLF